MFVGRSVADRSVSSLLIVVLESLIENTAQSRQGWASEIRGSTRVFARPQSDSIQGLFSPSSKELTRGPSFNKVAGTHRWLVYPGLTDGWYILCRSLDRKRKPLHICYGVLKNGGQSARHFTPGLNTR